MTQDERLIELEHVIKSQGKITLDYICQTYHISSDSARRDLVKLTQLPHILRIRGGAILADKRVESPFLQRQQFSPDKTLLTAWAAKLVNPNEIVFVDAGTTSVSLARQLPTDIRVITNSVEVLMEVIAKKGIGVTVLGGTFDDFSHAVLGNVTLQQISHYQADKAFIGVSALSESGITTNTELDALQKRAMAKQSKKVICITSFTKFNDQLMYQSCSWSDIDLIITDRTPPENIVQLIEKNDVELVVLDSETV